MKRWVIAIVILSAALTFLILRRGFFSDATKRFEQIRESGAELISEIAKTEVIAPPPLRAERLATRGLLTEDGVVIWTNASRREAGLPALARSAELHVAADLKLKDMFAKQYFAHESPTGDGPGDVVRRAGYDFILIGENLALGDYQNDQALVQAWLDSPLHRENIMNTRFTEIGVAVGRGLFEGKMTWLAVQEFGLPRTACPTPDAALRAQIESNQRELDARAAELDRRRAELEERRDRKRVDEYNALVGEYNRLVDDTKALVERYNQQVIASNACIRGG